jgi:putative ABC transport system permease protein
MDALRQDLRHAARRLARSPGFTAVALLSLGLGIGGNTIVFSVVNALFLRPLPVARPAEVAAVFTSDHSGGRYGTSSFPDYLDIRERTDAFAGLTAYAFQPLSLAVGGVPEMVVGEAVSANYFDVLGVEAARGRALRPEDDAPGAPPVVVLGHALWQGRFAGDEGLVGRSLTLSGRSFTVVGVAPPGFGGLTRGLQSALWLPASVDESLRAGQRLASRGARDFQLLGRLKPGVGLEQAQARLDLVAAQLQKEHPDLWTDAAGRGRRLSLLPESRVRLFPQVQGPVLGFVGLLTAIVGVVLVIACVNVANLLLTRHAARRQEVAIRLSLGASRGRLVRHFLTETLVVGALGGACGVLLALWATDLLTAFRPPLPFPVQLDVAVDGRVLGFAAALSLLMGAAVGLLPALQASRPDLVPELKGLGAATRTGPARLRSTFVVAQVALSLSLLVAAGLLLRSLRNAAALDPGFSARQGLLVSFDVSLSGLSEAQGRSFYQRLADRVGSMPAVQAVSWTTSPPLALDWMRRAVWVEGEAGGAGGDREVACSIVGPRFFETMGIGLSRGRAFGEADGPRGPGVVVVNEAFAQRYWPGADPIGQRLSVTGADGTYLEVIGVARDGKYWTLGEERRTFFYLPFAQNYQPSATLVVRTAGDPQGVAAPIRTAVRDVDPTVPVFGMRTMAEHVGVSLLPARVAGTVLALFGALGVALACLGVYGVMAYSVARRTREIGIRMALGARRGQVLALVLREGARLVGVGMVIGLALATAGARLLTSVLYGVAPTDLLTLSGVALLFGAVALLACYLPARRATRVDPLAALRQD